MLPVAKQKLCSANQPACFPVLNMTVKISLNEGPQLEQADEKFGELVHYREGDLYIIEARHTGEPVFNPRWTMHPGGWLELDCEFRMNGVFDNLGINFSYPEEKITGMKWLAADLTVYGKTG
jgi:hypothetical protein